MRRSCPIPRRSSRPVSLFLPHHPGCRGTRRGWLNGWNAQSVSSRSSARLSSTTLTSASSASRVLGRITRRTVLRSVCAPFPQISPLVGEVGYADRCRARAHNSLPPCPLRQRMRRPEALVPAQINVTSKWLPPRQDGLPPFCCCPAGT